MQSEPRRVNVCGASCALCFAAWLAITSAAAHEISVKRSAVDVSIGPPSGITTDRWGNIFFSSPNLVLKLDGRQTLTRVAGNVAAGYAGDDGPATQALLNFPASYPELERDPIDYGELVAGLAVDTAGNLYIADVYNNRVRKVDTTGTITTVVGEPSSTFTKWPVGVATDSVGNVYVSYQFGTLLKREPGGATTMLAGNDCGHHEAAGLCVPQQIAVDANGNVLVPDGYCRVRKVESSGAVVSIAGDQRPSRYFNFTCGFSGDGGPATLAAMTTPFGVAIDMLGNLYIADTYNDRIRKVDAGGTITTIAGGTRGYSGDGGPAADATLNLPHGIAVDGAGNIYIADTGNNRIRMVSSNGIISTIAGNGNSEPFYDVELRAGAVVEFYNPDLDNYFITADQDEQAQVESGAVGRWQRTGGSFNAGGPDQVCRFAGNSTTNPATAHAYGPNSHFYTANPSECASLKAMFTRSAPSWKFEGNDFSISRATSEGCSANLTPVYRAYNNGFARGIDSNHRITSNVAAYLAMVAVGWIGEGVVMCATQ